MLTLFSAGMGRRHLSEHWREARDGDEAARALFDRHYSRYVYADGRAPKLFVGPGEKFVMLTEGGDALFVWRKFLSADGQTGVNCAIFRNESPILSSALILEAEAIAHARCGRGNGSSRMSTRARSRRATPAIVSSAPGGSASEFTKSRRLLIFAKEPA